MMPASIRSLVNTINRSGPASYAAGILCVLAFYIVSYLRYPDRAGRNPAAPLGWWGWFDQGQYLKALNAFLAFDFSPVAHFYPPLYPALGALTYGLLPQHPFLLLNAVCLAIHLFSLFWIAGRLYGVALSWVVIVGTFVLFAPLTTLMWAIPWTTSLSAGLGAVLLIVYFHFHQKAASFTVDSTGDGGALSVFFLAYGALLATRPADVLIYFPLALVLFIQIIRRRGFTRFKPLLSVCALIAVSGLVVPALYVWFNLHTFGSVFGNYLNVVQANGYFPADIPEKAVSLLLDSRTLYVEPRQALADRFWPLLLGLPTLVVLLVTGPALLRVLAVTILLQYLVYLPYADLTPNNLFRFLTVHYFKWTLPWLAVLSVGQIVAWISAARTDKRSLLPLTAVIGLSLLLLNTREFIASTEIIGDERDPGRRQIAVAFAQPRSFDFIDIVKTTRTADLIPFARIDDRRLRQVRDFQTIAAPWGMRIVFVRPVSGSQLLLRFDPGAPIEDGSGTSRIGTYGFSLACRFTRCLADNLNPAAYPVRPVARAPDKLRLLLAAGGNADPFIGSGWAPGEAPGRWTVAASASLLIPNVAGRVSTIEAEIFGVLNAMRSRQPISITINGCEVINTELRYPEDAGVVVLTGRVPPDCAKGGPVAIEFKTDRVVALRDIGVDDPRAFGAGMVSLSLR